MNLFDQYNYISAEVFSLLEERIRKVPESSDEEVRIVADLIRYNTLLSVARAGTGHLGASLSIMEILGELYFRRMSVDPDNAKDVNRDIFVLSKGHAVPGLYAALAAKGFINNRELDRLRRWGGLQGHCDIGTPGIESNTGSLAMGLSRAVGYAIAKKRFGLNGKVYAIVGDGELQEGQIWEALISASSYKLSNLFVIIDQNQVQTDQYVGDIVKYGDLSETLDSMGFDVYCGPANTATQTRIAFEALDNNTACPKVFLADTIKGQGIDFMEHHHVLLESADRYVWHNKVPNSEELDSALSQIMSRTKQVLTEWGVAMPSNMESQNVPLEKAEVGIEGEKITPGFQEALAELAEANPIVVLDADLESDCGLSSFRELYPDRFFEMGIMEQHMVSAAAAFCKLGYIPIVNSYAAFLTSRANEQIYNLATEYGKAVIVGHMAGVIPATPGKSHQAYRDISSMKNIHGIRMYQPVTATDCKNIMNRFMQEELGERIYLRLSMAASAVKIPEPDGDLKSGFPHIVREGTDAIVICCGPVLTGECIAASIELQKKGVSIEIWNHPWLCEYNENELKKMASRSIPVIIIEDHYIAGGLGESFYSSVAKAGLTIKKTIHLGIKDFTATGFRAEALKALGIGSDAIMKAVEELTCAK